MFLILSSANIVVSTIVLFELRLTSASGYLVVQSLITVTSLAIYMRFRRSLNGVDQAPETELIAVSKESRLQYIVVTTLLVIVVLATLINLFLALYVPTNVYDSMTQHISRVGDWFHHSSLRLFYAQNPIQNTFPPNAEILILLSVTFLKSNILANLVEWISAIGTSLVIYGIAVLPGFASSVSLLSALMYLSLHMVMRNYQRYCQPGVYKSKLGHIPGSRKNLSRLSTYTENNAAGFDQLQFYRCHKP